MHFRPSRSNPTRRRCLPWVPANQAPSSVGAMGAGDDLSLRTTSFGTLITVLLWVTSNVGTLFLNKVVLTEYKFDKPIILTAIHVSRCGKPAVAAERTRSENQADD